MITAQLAGKPYLKISKAAYQQLAQNGSKTVKISIQNTNGKKRPPAREKPSRKTLLEFADKTLGIWADDPKIEQAFAELEERWQQWREETLS